MNHIEISTTRYEWSHGRKPRGCGYWAFRIGDDPEPYWSKPCQSFTQAARDARKLAVAHNVTTIDLLP